MLPQRSSVDCALEEAVDGILGHRLLVLLLALRVGPRRPGRSSDGHKKKQGLPAAFARTAISLLDRTSAPPSAGSAATERERRRSDAPQPCWMTCAGARAPPERSARPALAEPPERRRAAPTPHCASRSADAPCARCTQANPHTRVNGGGGIEVGSSWIGTYGHGSGRLPVLSVTALRQQRRHRAGGARAKVKLRDPRLGPLRR